MVLIEQIAARALKKVHNCLQMNSIIYSNPSENISMHVEIKGFHRKKCYKISNIAAPQGTKLLTYISVRHLIGISNVRDFRRLKPRDRHCGTKLWILWLGLVML